MEFSHGTPCPYYPGTTTDRARGTSDGVSTRHAVSLLSGERRRFGRGERLTAFSHGTPCPYYPGNGDGSGAGNV